ncbi:hypothetical protein FOCC_FOCC001952 [Frankliniella occidentalis]|nr:hypothetical protein FOCC_FOCC001952 [Frankliniella occidentalis]
MLDHSEFSSWCKLVNGTATDNVPLAEGELPPLPELQAPELVSRGIVEMVCPENPCLLDLNIMLARVHRHPKYIDEGARLDSFKKWGFEDTIKGEALAEAGFFNIGGATEDKTTCFSCGGSLRGWTKEDNAWVEHAKYFSRCPFLLCEKGKDFVTAVTKSLKPVEGTKAQKSEDPRITCKVCLDEEVAVLFLPCGHLVTCRRCSLKMVRCPVCRGEIMAYTVAILA